MYAGKRARTKNWNFYLMATTMQVYGFHVFTDIFGDIPFSQALKGDQGISEPAYESSEVNLRFFDYQIGLGTYPKILQLLRIRRLVLPTLFSVGTLKNGFNL